MNIPNNNYRNNIKNTPQVWGGLILLRKEFNPLRFIGEWLTYAQDDRIITDSPNVFSSNDAIFKEHRHDQSILSLLCKKWGIQMHMLDNNFMINVRNCI